MPAKWGLRHKAGYFFIRFLFFRLRRRCVSVQPAFPIISYDIHAATINADITSRLLPLGKPTQILDTQIASIAIANNLILVTHNTKDFKVFQKKFNLMLEDWQ